MQLSRRNFLRGTAVSAASLAIPSNVLAWREPARSPKPGGPVNLASNENPYGAFPSAKQAMQDAIAVTNRYPDYEFTPMWEALSKLHGCTQDEITAGSGSTDILRVAAESFCSQEHSLVTATPTFEALAAYAKRNGAPVLQVPLRKDFAHDLDAMLAKCDANTGLVYICNPNNPTASITPRAEIEAFIAKLPRTTYVLIDEAYHHFAVGSPGYESFADKRLDNPRVIVARTFSKIYGMAGIRVGYAVAAKQTIDRISTYNVQDSPNVVGVRAAVASLNDTAMLETAVRRTLTDRTDFERQANSRNLQMIPSHANFVMFDTKKPIREVIAYFKKNNVWIGRPFPPYETYARVTLGTPDEMRTFWKVWDGL